jgi:hypothetical protein
MTRLNEPLVQALTGRRVTRLAQPRLADGSEAWYVSRKLKVALPLSARSLRRPPPLR